MEWVETTGKTVEEARESALDQLGVDVADAEFEILDEPKAGLFGLRKSEARIRARVKPAVPRSKDQNNRRKRRPEKERAPRRNQTDSEDSAQGTEDAPAPRSERKPKNTSKPEGARRTPRAAVSEGAQSVDEHVELADQAETAKTFLSGLLTEIDIQASIDIELNETDELILVSVQSEGNSAMGHLIGSRGTTLHALQELTRTVVQRKTGARNGRIILDISQYREKRRVALERFTRQIADEVLADKTTRKLEPMHPSDRKIVHDTVNDIDGVRTSSEGEEPRRYVVIAADVSA